MLSTRIISLVAALFILGLANVAAAQSLGDTLKDSAAAASKGVEAEVTRSRDAIAEKSQEAAAAKDEASQAAVDAKSEAQGAATAEEADVAAPPAPEEPMGRLGEAAKTGAVTATDAAARGSDLGTAAQKGGAAAINQYMAPTEAAPAAPAEPVGAAGEAADEAPTPEP